jgi:hypothetical protein
MGKGRQYTRPQRTRPRKNAGDRRRREKVQRRRLAAKGVPEEKIRTMTSKAVRDMLKG